MRGLRGNLAAGHVIMGLLVLASLVSSTAGAATHHFVCVCTCQFESQSFEVDAAYDCDGLNGVACRDSDGDDGELEGCRKSTEKWSMASPASDANADGRITVADAMFAYGAARGLRPVLVDADEPFAIPGQPLTVRGLNLLEGAENLEVVLRDPDDVPPGDRRSLQVQEFEVADGLLRLTVPQIQGDLGEMAVEVTATAVDPDSNQELPFRSNALPVTVVREMPPGGGVNVCIDLPQEMRFDDEEVAVPLGEAGELHAVLNGGVVFGPGNNPVGEVRVGLGRTALAMVRMTPEGVEALGGLGGACAADADCDAGRCFDGICAGSSLLLPTVGRPEEILIDGEPALVDNAMDLLMGDLLELGLDGVDRWSPGGQASLALLALATSPAWQRLVVAGVNQGVLASFLGINWCKVSAYGAAAALVVLTQLGCGALEAACVGATTITVGGMAIPCAWAIAACQGGSFASAAAAYEAVLALWDP